MNKDEMQRVLNFCAELLESKAHDCGAAIDADTQLGRWERNRLVTRGIAFNEGAAKIREISAETCVYAFADAPNQAWAHHTADVETFQKEVKTFVKQTQEAKTDADAAAAGAMALLSNGPLGAHLRNQLMEIIKKG